MSEDNINPTEPILEFVDEVEQEIDEISIDSAFPSFGEPNEELKHSLLHQRDLEDQHPIVAITGLRTELDNIESLKHSLRAKNINYADYFLWQDENQLQNDRVGYFVSIVPSTNKIRICTDMDEIFGVTVNSAAHIGGEDDVARDYRYGLVSNNGIVNVRCESDVTTGDYVVSNAYGVAMKNNYGYKVVAISDNNGIFYATISLSISSNQTCHIGDGLSSLTTRVGNAEANIVSAINVANVAHNLALDASRISGNIEAIAENALSVANQTNDSINNLNINDINSNIAQTRSIAESAVTAAQNIRSESVEASNNAILHVNGLVDELEPIITWTDPSGNTGANYLTDYIDNGLATKEEIRIVETHTENVLSETVANATKIETMMSSIDKYSIGEYSQALGLSHEQAKSILKPGMIYIPTDCIASSSYTHNETYSGDPDYIASFTKGYHYIWDGEYWVESDNPSVFFSEEYVVPINNYIYWYVSANSDISYGIGTYKAKTLYMCINGEWIEINTLDGNTINRVNSIVKQTANEFAAEVTNARGSCASLSAKLDEQSVQTSMVAAMSEPSDVAIIETVSGVESLPSSANNGAYYAVEDYGRYVIYRFDGSNWKEQKHLSYDGTNVLKINAASIVNSVNDAGSSISLNAQKINFVSQSFSIFPSNNGSITSDIPNFSVDTNGNVKVVGTIEVVGSDSNVPTKAETVTSSIDEWALSTSSSSFIAIEGSSGVWSTAAPDRQDGAYMWQRRTVTKADGSEPQVTQTCIQGADGVSTYDVVVSKESFIVNCSSTGIAKNGEVGENGRSICEINAYKGTTLLEAVDGEATPSSGQFKYTIGSVVGGTASRDSNTTFRLDSIVDDTGIIPITIYFESNENTVVKQIGFFKLKDPSKITSVKTQYCLSSSNLIVPGDGDAWSDVPPVYVPGKYYWTRIYTTYEVGYPTTSDPVYDEISTVAASNGLSIGQWCSANDSTKIDGSKIYTGSITADQLSVDAITSSNYVLNTSGVHIDLSNGRFESKNFNIDENGNVSMSGSISATSGIIGGWNIQPLIDGLQEGKIYSGDGTSVKTAVIQAPSSTANWVFAAGGNSHNGYGDCPFRVDKQGNLYANNIWSNTFHTKDLLKIDGGTVSYSSSGEASYYNSGFSLHGATFYNGQLTTAEQFNIAYGMIAPANSEPSKMVSIVSNPNLHIDAPNIIIHGTGDPIMPSSITLDNISIDGMFTTVDGWIIKKMGGYTECWRSISGTIPYNNNYRAVWANGLYTNCIWLNNQASGYVIESSIPIGVFMYAPNVHVTLQNCSGTHAAFLANCPQKSTRSATCTGAYDLISPYPTGDLNYVACFYCIGQ